jgi:NADH-quinone oxidoreductase subunit J
MEAAVFIVSAVLIFAGALGVIFSPNPVHSAIFLVETLFGVAILLILQDANFLAAVQVIVYAGAIVILFLFVIMLLGVDRAEQLRVEPIAGQRPLAVIIGAAAAGVLITAVVAASDALTGKPSTLAPLGDPKTTADVKVLGDHLFTDFVFAFEITALLLTIAVVGAVMLARKPTGPLDPIPVVETIDADDADDTDEADDATRVPA